MAGNATTDSKYPGPLGEPVVIRDAPASAGILGPNHPDIRAARDAELQRLQQELLKKLPLLLDHFGIDRNAPDSWMQLAFGLARAHVPGMQVIKPRKTGAPQTWGPVELAALNIEVELLTKQGMTAMAACRALMHLPDGSWRFPRSRDAKTLYRRYQESKKSSIVRALQSVAEDPELHQIFQESILEAVANANSASSE